MKIKAWALVDGDYPTRLSQWMNGEPLITMTRAEASERRAQYERIVPVTIIVPSPKKKPARRKVRKHV
jgi:hypothetical protein